MPATPRCGSGIVGSRNFSYPLGLSLVEEGTAPADQRRKHTSQSIPY
jgi:hypothetical protein